MAKQITDEKIKLSIIIDGNPAQKELYDLEKSTRSLTHANKDLKKERALLAAQGKKDTEEYKKLSAAIKENNASITSNKARMGELQKQIGLTGLTMGQLQAKARELTFKLRNLIPGSADYKRYDAELKQISARMDELKGKGAAARFSIGKLADNFNRYAALGASIIATGTGVVLSLQKMIYYNGKLSDAQADVMKTTQMSKEEVDELTKSFGMLQSRTSRINLLGIAEQGGRIGIRKEEIQDFVNVMDKANVALGDSFTGGAEEVAEKLGKIKFLFEETKNVGVEESYMAIGSAINDLGANGVASERNIAEFTTRLGSLPSVLKPSVAETLALGAAFEESGIEAEISARAYSIFLKQASSESKKFAKVMGISQAQVEKMINDNPMEFMLTFAEGFKGVNMEATDTAKILDYLGVNADGANKAIGAMANNTDRFRELIDISNDSFATGTSLINEYNIKNNTLGATLEKIKKTVSGWFSSETFVAWLESAFNWFAKFIGATEDASGEVEGFRNKLVFFLKTLAIVITSYISYNTAVRLTTLLTKGLSSAQTILNAINGRGRVISNLLRSSTLLLSAGYHLVTGNITKASAAMRLFNITVKANPLGLLLGLMAGLVTAYFAFRKNTDEAVKSQKKLNTAMEVELEKTKLLSKSKADLKSKVEPLIKILKDETASLSVRKTAYEKLISISSDFIGTVDAEYKATNKLTEAYGKLIEKLEQAALAKAREAVRQKRANELALAESAEFDAKLKADAEAAANAEKRKRNEERAAKALERVRTSTNEYSGLSTYQESYDTSAKEEYQKAVQRTKQARMAMEGYTRYQTETIARLQEELKKHKEGSEEAKKIQAEIDSILGSVNETMTEAGNSNYIVPESETEESKAKKKREKELDDLKKFEDDVLELKRKATDERLAQMQDGYLKEKMIEDENHRRKIEDLKKQLISEKDIMAADQKINSPNASKSDIDFWIRQKEAWIEKNRHLNDLISIEERRHVLALETIDLNSETKKINDLQETYDKESVIRETAFNNQLALLGKNEDAKKQLQEKYNKEELDRQEAHLKKLLEEFESIIAGNNPEVQLDLLPKEKIEELKRNAEALKLKLSEIAKAKAGITENQGDFERAAGAVFGDADILGFTEAQWEKTFTNISTLSGMLEALSMGIGAMQNMWSLYNDFVAAGENRQLANFEKNSDAKKRKLKWQLDNGYINQIQYKRGLEQLDADLERKKAEIEYKQAKRQKQMALVDATINTAKGVTAAIPNLVLMGLAAAAGALQIATIARQPLPAKGYEEGLYQDVRREQDGKVFRSRYGGKTKSGLVKRPTHFLTGENGPEMIIDSKAYRRMSPETRYALEREIRQIKGFERGYYSDDVRNPVYNVPIENNTGTVSTDLLAGIISKNTEIMEKIYSQGVVAWISRDPRNLKKLEEDIDRIKNSREKAKQ